MVEVINKYRFGCFNKRTVKHTFNVYSNILKSLKYFISGSFRTRLNFLYYILMLLLHVIRKKLCHCCAMSVHITKKKQKSKKIISNVSDKIELHFSFEMINDIHTLQCRLLHNTGVRSGRYTSRNCLLLQTWKLSTVLVIFFCFLKLKTTALSRVCILYINLLFTKNW